jgi:hypothetical protein
MAENVIKVWVTIVYKAIGSKEVEKSGVNITRLSITFAEYVGI